MNTFMNKNIREEDESETTYSKLFKYLCMKHNLDLIWSFYFEKSENSQNLFDLTKLKRSN